MKKKNKILISIAVAIIIVIVVIIIAISSLIKNTEAETAAYTNYNFSSLDLSKVADGTYTGSEDATMVQASVEVTVKDHVITKITILSHKNGKGKPAEVIVDDIVQANTLDVDVISGATYSSGVLKVAVYNALMSQ